MKKDDRVYIWDMVSACRKIQQYLDGKTVAQMETNGMLFDAVIRQFEILGEAANNVSVPMREQLKNIPWRKVVDMRNVLIHQYAGIQISRVWETAQHDIPVLLQDLLPPYEQIQRDISSDA